MAAEKPKESATERPPYHIMPESTVLDKFKSSLDTGLSNRAVETNRALYGYNELRKKEGKSMLELILD